MWRWFKWVGVLIAVSCFAQAPPINAVSQCGVPVNQTDAHDALQTCLSLNPGRHIQLPKLLSATNGGGAVTNCDYYSSGTLVMSGNGQKLSGETPANWSGAVCIKFAPGIAGIQVDSNTYSIELDNLELNGQMIGVPWTGPMTGPGPDGIQLGGGEPTLKNVNVVAFARHGIFLDGGSSIWTRSQPDSWRFDRVRLDANGADGILAQGCDANAGLATFVDARFNVRYGVEDNACLGNTWISVETTNNQAAAFGGRDTFSTWIGPYIESGQVTKLATGNIVLGSNFTPPPQDYTVGHPLWLTANQPYFYGNGGFVFREPSDLQLSFQLMAGKTLDATEVFRFLGGFSGKAAWEFGWYAGQQFGLRDLSTSAFPLSAWPGGRLVLTAQNGSQIQLFAPGGVKLGPTTSLPLCYAPNAGVTAYVPGTAGVKDTMEVCAKDASDSYAWRSLY